MEQITKKRGESNLLRRKTEQPVTQVWQVRAAMKITQAEFAALLHVHEDTVRRWETAGSKPNRWLQAEIDRLARAHGVATSP